ncbi:hypothetical protein K443DRAFT_632624 [Laccaria amethystina LaAM-08-1]|uniref:Uncharacterized protein n=1 Tax=Laccaria amethystina LaAM-08-1 TaxID=1095629 RepID=A0A0C9XLX6_9AGAR|nr:hypothetical protein K443DRAFT_632624 [Laccaria amethystina LaAM-08-1]
MPTLNGSCPGSRCRYRPSSPIVSRLSPNGLLHFGTPRDQPHTPLVTTEPLCRLSTTPDTRHAQKKN